MTGPILGIDPGKTGALALYTPATGALDVEDVPTLTIRSGRSKRLVVDHYALARIVDTWAPLNPTVWLEQVGTRPGEGAVGAFDFGRTYGLLLGIAAAHFLRIELVTPATWKAALKVKGDKDVSRQRASTLLPRHSGKWPMVKHDGRAEAALIALYGAGHATPANRRLAA
jgi:crossover junction endodeoxyribonuclease RuvC